jgi:hypothetical protein
MRRSVCILLILYTAGCHRTAVEPAPRVTPKRDDPASAKNIARAIAADRLHEEFDLGGEFVLVVQAQDVLDPAVLDKIERLTEDLLAAEGVTRVESLATRMVVRAVEEGAMLIGPVTEAESQEPPPADLLELIRGNTWGRPLVTDDKSRALLFVYRSDLHNAERLLDIAGRVAPGLRLSGYDPVSGAGGAEAGDLPVDSVRVRVEAQGGSQVLSSEALACLHKLEARAKAVASYPAVSVLNLLRVVRAALGQDSKESLESLPTPAIRQMLMLAEPAGSDEERLVDYDNNMLVMTVPVRPGAQEASSLRRALRPVGCPGFELTLHGTVQ